LQLSDRGTGNPDRLAEKETNVKTAIIGAGTHERPSQVLVGDDQHAKDTVKVLVEEQGLSRRVRHGSDHC
jgi:predicted dinucleotide-binding enzyme